MKVKRTGIITKILVLVLLASAAATLLSIQSRLKAAQVNRDLLTQQIQRQQEINAALEDDIAHSSDPDYLADIARDKLGLLEPGEIVFIDPAR